MFCLGSSLSCQPVLYSAQLLSQRPPLAASFTAESPPQYAPLPPPQYAPLPPLWAAPLLE